MKVFWDTDPMNEQLALAEKMAEHGGTRMHGATYEQGVKNTLEWLLGKRRKPLEASNYLNLNDVPTE